MQNIGAWLGTHGGIFLVSLSFPSIILYIWLLYFIAEHECIYMGLCVQAVPDVIIVAVCPAGFRCQTALMHLPGVCNTGCRCKTSAVWVCWSLHRDTLNVQLGWGFILGFQVCEPVRFCSCSGLPGNLEIPNKWMSSLLSTWKCLGVKKDAWENLSWSP